VAVALVRSRRLNGENAQLGNAELNECRQVVRMQRNGAPADRSQFSFCGGNRGSSRG
jgi:hypothetical protein